MDVHRLCAFALLCLLDTSTCSAAGNGMLYLGVVLQCIISIHNRAFHAVQ